MFQNKTSTYILCVPSCLGARKEAKESRKMDSVNTMNNKKNDSIVKQIAHHFFSVSISRKYNLA